MNDDHLRRRPGRPPKTFSSYEHLTRGRGRPIISIKRRRNTLADNLGALITELRIARKWSQNGLGERIGYSKNFLGKVERGRQNPRLGFLIKVAQVFGLRTSQFLAQVEKRQRKG